jgi:putative MATE family efflux protein
LEDAYVLLDPGDRALFRRIWALTWPMVVYNVLELTLGLVDLLMVRPFGPAATAAVGVSRQVTFLVEAAAVAISTGVITLVSQGVGAQAWNRVDAVVRQSVRLVLLLGVPTTLAGVLLSRPLLIWLNAGPEILAYGTPYLRIYFGGIVFLWSNLVGTALFRGAGDVWTPLKIALGVSLLHVGLNYLFIHGAGPLPAFEVAGAAIGTVAARACGAVIWLGILLRGRSGVRLRFTSLAAGNGADAGDGRRGPDWPLIGRMLRIGVPMALAGMLRNGSRLVFLAIVGASSLGVALQAAVGVGMQMRQLSILPALAFQVATAALVGQAIGRGDYPEAELLGRRSVQLLGLLMAVVVVLIIALAGPLAALFIDSPEAAALGAKVLRWFAVAQLLSALNIATQGALMGAGDTGPALRYTLVSEWGVMLALAYAALRADAWLPDSLLAAWTLAPALTLVLMRRRWRSGVWKDLRA